MEQLVVVLLVVVDQLEIVEKSIMKFEQRFMLGPVPVCARVCTLYVCSQFNWRLSRFWLLDACDDNDDDDDDNRGSGGGGGGDGSGS